MTRTKFKHLALFGVASALAFVLFAGTGGATPTEQCLESFAAKANGEVARLRNDYAKIAPSDTSRATDLKRLSLLRRIDQEIREPLLHRCGVALNGQELKPVAGALIAADQWNQKQLQLILGRIGWPVISRYGAEADQTAFLIVQHATNDLSFQRDILTKLEKLLAAKETGGENYALLYDRVHETERRMQRFGTQGNCRGTTWISYPDRGQCRGRQTARRTRHGTARAVQRFCGKDVLPRIAALRRVP